MTAAHRWRFFRTGGVDQVILDRGADLIRIGDLDQKLWVALAMPTDGLDVDPRTLALLDSDQDGRIRAPEIVEAARWMGIALKRPEDLIGGDAEIALDAIADETLRAGAARILSNLGRADAKTIRLEDVADTAKVFADTRFNGDGVVPAEAAGDDALTRRLIEDLLTVVAPVIDRSGKPGVDQASADAFFVDLKAYVAWADEADQAVRTLGDGTDAAGEALRAVRGKVDDYFTRCRLAGFDARTAAVIGGSDADLIALGGKELSPAVAEVARLPLARIEPGRPLPLDDGLNPAWVAPLASLRTHLLAPIGATTATLSEAQWVAVCARFAAFEVWRARKPAVAAEALGLPRLREIAASDVEKRLTELIRRDQELETENAQIEAVERLLLFRRDLARVLNNFVNFSEFYGRKGAIFQAGTLFLDGRSCHLCLRVPDVVRHAAMAPLSATFLAYCDCVRPGEKISIAAAFTDGDSDNLMVGRNGVFYDRKGRDWDATITRIVANPIGVREAFWAPYKKLVRLIEDQVGKRAAAAAAESHARMDHLVGGVSAAPPPGKPTDGKTGAPLLAPSGAGIRGSAEHPKIDIGTVAAIGVAVGGIGAMVAGILSAFFGLGAWMPLGFVAVVLLISGPAMLLAYLKLRQRNLGPLLDAAGWAINGRARINVPFGAALTDVAALPPGTRRSLRDPFADKRRPWILYVALVLLALLAAAWYLGRLDRLLPDRVRSTHVLGAGAPAQPPPGPAAPPPATMK